MKDKNHSPHIFHNYGWNLLNSITYNRGLNFILAFFLTWLMIKTGIDWQLRNFMLDNSHVLAWISMPALLVGNFIPIIIPLVFLISGKSLKNKKSVMAASALTQTVMQALFFQSALKMITGRSHPIIGFGFDFSNRIFFDVRAKADDFSGSFDWFNMNALYGWPSGHTITAVSAAAALAEIYHDNRLIKVCAYSYAAVMGFSMAVHAHWTSDVVAGALIGYAVGKSVGKSYRKFFEETGDKDQPASCSMPA